MDAPSDQTGPGIVHQTACENCAAEVMDMKYCPHCSFPVGGNNEEKNSFRLTVSSRKRLLGDAHDKIKSAKTIMIILAVLTCGVGLFEGFYQDDFLAMIIDLCLGLLYFIFVAWSAKNPLGAILTAFIIYLTVIVLNAFDDPVTLGQGIILKIIFIGAFIKGVRSAQEAQQFMKELEKLKAVPREY